MSLLMWRTTVVVVVVVSAGSVAAAIQERVTLGRRLR